jgi:hypothetical protein
MTLDPQAAELLAAIQGGDTSAIDPLCDWLREGGYDQAHGTTAEARLWVAMEACQAYMRGKWTVEMVGQVFAFLSESLALPRDIHRVTVSIERRRNPGWFWGSQVRIKIKNSYYAYMTAWPIIDLFK